MIKMKGIMIVLVGLILMLGTHTAAAHQSDESMHVTEVRPESGEVEQLISISAEDLAHHFDHVGHHEFPSPAILEQAHDTFLAYLEANTPVQADGDECELKESKFVGYPGPDGRLHYHQLWQCPEGSKEIRLKNTVLFDMHGDGYRHMARVQVGEVITPTVFDEKFPEYNVYLGEVREASGEEVATISAEVAQDDGEQQERKQRTLFWPIFAVVAFVLVMGGLIFGGKK